MAAEDDRSKHAAILVLRRDFPLLRAYVAPRTPTESKLAEIFCRALGMDEVSIADDFEELGGDSLLAASICTDMENTFRIALPIAFLLRSPTIERLAPIVEELVSKRQG